MSKKVWGPITWIYFHTVAEKIKPESFIILRDDMIKMVTKICDTLPCPECRGHATQNLRYANLERIRTKEHFIDFLYEFHNRVNTQTKKKLYPRENLKIYSTYSTEKVVKSFLSVYSNNSYNSRMIADTFHRQQLYRWIVTFFKSHSNEFEL